MAHLQMGYCVFVPQMRMRICIEKCRGWGGVLQRRVRGGALVHG